MTAYGGKEGNPSISTPLHSSSLYLLVLFNLNAFYTYIFKLRRTIRWTVQNSLLSKLLSDCAQRLGIAAAAEC